MHSLVKPPAQRTAWARGAYLLVVLLGAYIVIWALTGFSGVALYRLGLARSEAVIFSTLLGLVLYPALVIAALAARRRRWLWTMLMATSAVLELASRYWGGAGVY